jgi:UDP-N-acetylglucosamine 2-epimerase (non-hydrolysing)
MTILGTRPEIIRLSIVIEKLDKQCKHLLVHTGQNYEESLNDIFFRDLHVRQPDYALGIKANSFGEQIGKIIFETEKILIHEKPDRLLILGDTNSGLAAIVAKRLGISVFHMEAGNRCYDDRVPEEINRKIIDHSSDILMPYTYRSKENLVHEGFDRKIIYVIGNPIFEILNHFSDPIIKSDIHHRLNILPHQYFLVTMHRAENVDIEHRLKNIVYALENIHKHYNLPIICSLHPRTKNKMKKFHLRRYKDNITFLSPPGFFDFVALEKNALCVLSDSGTVQEECSIFKIPNITIRDVTERPETIECGGNMLSGVEWRSVVAAVKTVLSLKGEWNPPPEYLDPNVSDTVLKILLGFNFATVIKR